MKETLISYINKQFIDEDLDEKVTADDDLLGSGVLDSLGMMKLILFIEQEFGVQVPPEDMIIENFTTIDAMHDYIVSKK